MKAVAIYTLDGSEITDTAIARIADNPRSSHRWETWALLESPYYRHLQTALGDDVSNYAWVLANTLVPSGQTMVPDGTHIRAVLRRQRPNIIVTYGESVTLATTENYPGSADIHELPDLSLASSSITQIQDVHTIVLEVARQRASLINARRHEL